MPEWNLVEITDRAGRVLEPAWLERSEGVHRQLRPQLMADYAGAMQRVFEGGGRMVVATRDEAVYGVALWRSGVNTFAGRYLYVDDLVTDAAHRSRGAGKALLARCAAIATELGCAELVLDSGVQRADAHRFYFREGMAIHAFNFSRSLAPRD
ncbi:MAG: GNAT family N-acetyltransferase [Polyangiaceae bacterium]